MAEYMDYNDCNYDFKSKKQRRFANFRLILAALFLISVVVFVIIRLPENVRTSFGPVYSKSHFANEKAKGEKYRRAEQIADGREYLSAYNRQRQRGNLGSARFRVVAPDEAKAYIDETAAVYRDSERDEKKQARRERCPKALLGLYRKIRRG